MAKDLNVKKVEQEDPIISGIRKQFNSTVIENDVIASSELLPAKIKKADAAKVNVTDYILTELEKRTEGLTINGIEDKDGFEIVKSWRLLAKRVRTAGVAITKAGRAPAIAEEKAWIAVEKEFEDRVSITEDRLKKLEDDHKNLVEAEKQRIANEQTNRYTARSIELSNIGALYDTSTSKFKLGEIEFDGGMIREADSDVFNDILEAFKDEHSRLHKEEEDRQEEARAKQQNDLREARKMLLTAIDAPLPDFDLGTIEMEDWQSIYSSAREIYDAEQQRIKDNLAKKTKETLDARIKALREIGFVHDNNNVVFVKENEIKIHTTDIELSGMDEVDFKNLYHNFSTRVVEIEDEFEAEQERRRKESEEKVRTDAIADTRRKMLAEINFKYEKDDLGTMPDDEWNVRFSKAKELFDTKKREQEELELQAKSDREQWKHFIEILERLQLPSPKGKAYGEKVRVATNLINQIKNL